MAKITNIGSFTSYWRDNYPSLYGDRTDEDVVSLVRERHPELKVPTYQEALVTHTDPPKEDTKNSESLKDQDTDPSWVNSWFLTGDFIPDSWQEEGFAGISPEFFQTSFNNSMAGGFYKTVKGEDKYEVNPGYDPSWYAQAGQFAVGLLSPLDAGVMIGTGALGKVVAGATRATLFGRAAGAKYLEKGILSNFAAKSPKIGTAAMNMVDGALELGIGGGAFAASHAMVQETARQRGDNPEQPVNINKALKVASDEFLHALPMFAITGGVTKGIMGSLHGYATAYMDDASYAGKVTRAATHPAAQVGAEATLFTSLPAVFGQEDAPKFMSDEWKAALGTNALIVAGMRSVGYFTEDRYHDATKFLMTEMKLETASGKKLKDAAKTVSENLAGDAPVELRNTIRKVMAVEQSLPTDLAIIKKDMNFLQEMNRNLRDTEYLKQVAIEGTKQNKEWVKYFDLSNEYSTGLKGVIESVTNNKDRLAEHFKAEEGRNPTKPELDRMEKSLQSWGKDITETREWVEEYLGGNVRTSEDGIMGGKPGTPPERVPRTDIEGVKREQALKDWTDAELFKRAQDMGFEEGIEFKVNRETPDKPFIENKEKLINRLFDKKKAQRLEAEQKATLEGKTIAGIVVEELGIYKEPFQQRKVNIDKKSYENKVEETRTFIDIKDDATYVVRDKFGGIKKQLTKKEYDVLTIKEKKEFSKTKDTQNNLIRKTLKTLDEITGGDDMFLSGVYNSLKNIKGKKGTQGAAATIKSYSDGLTRYAKHLKEKGQDVYYATDMFVKDFLTKDGKIKVLGNVSLSDAAAVRNLYNWMASKSGFNLTKHPAEWVTQIFDSYNVKRAFATKKLPSWDNYKKITDNIISKFIAKKQNRELYDRAELFLELSTQTGIRNQEWFTQDFPGVRVQDIYHLKGGKTETPGINLSEINYIRVASQTSKTGQARFVPLTSKSITKLDGLIKKYKLGDKSLIFEDKFKKTIRSEVNKELKRKLLKIDKDAKPVIDDTRQIIQQAATFGAELSNVELQLINNMLGHQRTAIEKIYLKNVNTERVIKDTYNALVKVEAAKKDLTVKSQTKAAKPEPKPLSVKPVIEGTKAEKIKFWEKRAKRLTEEEVFQTNADRAVRDRFIENVMKKNKLSEGQLKREGLGKGVLGEFGEGVIKLQKGIWQPADFYHENLHRLKAFAKATKNKGLENLIERGEKLAVGTKEYKEWKKNNLNRDVEEFLADIVGGKASRMEFSKGLLNKVSQFVKQLVSRVKVAFGKGNFNDISRVLSKRVQKGFSTEGVKFAKGDVKYRLEGMSPESAYAYTRKTVKDLFQKGEYNESKANKIIRYVGELAELGEEFKLSKTTTMPELQQFIGTLNSIENKAFLRRLPNKEKWYRNFKDAEKIRLVKNVTESDRKIILKDLGVQEGKITFASNRQLKDFIEIVNVMDDVRNSSTSWIDQKVADGMIKSSKVADRFKAMTNKKAVLPVVFVLESIGLKKLSDRMYSHTAKELGYIGEFSKFEKNMETVFGRRKWDKTKDMMYLFDKERYFDRLQNKTLKVQEKKFINDAIDTKTWEPRNTKEGMLVKEHIKLMKFYKDSFIGKDGALTQVLNKAELEKFKNDKNINWLNEKNNIYVQRRLTEEFKKYYDPNANHFEQVVKDQAEHVAKKLAKDFYKGKDVSREKLSKKQAEFIESGDALAIAHGELYELFQFNPGKYSPSFLKERHTKLPEFIKLDGKNIEVYETKFGLTTKDYSINQSKFLANVEFFPEFVKLKGFNRPGAKELLGELRTKDSRMADWVDKQVKNHLKIDKAMKDYPDGVRILRHSTALLAKFQLSFPTSGLKNFVIGTSQSMLAYRMRHLIGGFADAIHKDNRMMVRASGATEIGMRHFELKGLTGVLDKIADKGFFRFGLMRFSENINRYVSVLAGKREQAFLSGILKSRKEGSRSYNKAINKLKSFYKLNDADIALLKKFGMNGTEGLDAITAGKNKRKLDDLYQKMNTYAHINTQGAALDLFMPDWSSGQVAQSALLYKRMAYAATVNTTRNMKIAFENGSLLRPIMFGVGAYVSGEVLLQFYDKILGQTMPKENSGEAQALKTALWKGEFLGILSDVLSPFGSEYVGQSMYPSMLSTANVIYSSFMSVIGGDKFASQGIDEALRGTAGLYNNTKKLYKQGLMSKDSYASQGKRLGKLYQDMIEEDMDREEMEVAQADNSFYKSNPYMQSFREIFNSGYDKDSSGNSIGKWYMMTLFQRANDYYVSGMTENGDVVDSPEVAFKKAVSEMQKSVTKLHPNKARVTAKDRKAKFRQLKKAEKFRQFLDRGDVSLSKLLIPTLNKQYDERIELLEKSAKEYIESGNLEKDIKSFGFKIGDLFNFSRIKF